MILIVITYLLLGGYRAVVRTDALQYYAMIIILALLAIIVFTSAVGFVLYSIGVGEHHTDVVWALGTSIVFLVTLLIDVWMFFAIAGEEAYQWKV